MKIVVIGILFTVMYSVLCILDVYWWIIGSL